MQTIALNAGTFLIPEFSATGGVTYRQFDSTAEQKGDTVDAQFSTHKHVDHVGLVTLSKSIINRATGVLDRLAINTPMGYFVPEGRLADIREALEPIKLAAHEFNQAAREAGSGRRVRISAYQVRLQEDDAQAAARLASVVRDRIADLRAALAAGDLKAYDGAWVRARGLDRLARGIQADAIKLALDAAQEARKEVSGGVREGLSAEEAAKRADLNALDSALYLFQEASDSGL